jgi:glutamine amidotransferase
MIGIIDCRIGNIGSLRNALTYLGAQVDVIRYPEELKSCSAVVLPGVGAFDPAMASVESSGFGDGIKAYCKENRPVLGICLGMQLLTFGSDEGVRPGLGLIDGRALNLRQLGCTGKVPHVGFNAIQSVSGTSSFLSGTVGRDFYFVHSFGLPDSFSTEARAFVDYQGSRFVAALHHDNIFATQFHPEKSGDAGLMLLQHFMSCSKNA